MNRETKSKLTKTSVGLKQNSLSLPNRKLEVLFNMNCGGMYGFMILSKYLARLYSAVFIIDTTGLSGKPGLCDLQRP